jgi:S1-C subfamily serine protease
MITTISPYGYLAIVALALSAEPDAPPPVTGSPVTESSVTESVAAADQQRIDTIARVVPSVVSVFAPSGTEGGSGVVISSDGYVLTNYHVVLGTGPWTKCGLSDGKLYDAVVVGVDPTGDIALVRMFGRDDFPVADFGDSDTITVGDGVFVMGNPFMLATDLQPTVTYGIVSGLQRYQYPSGTFLEYTDCIQTDASINPGNSGGPLFDSDGRLVGINGRASFEKRGRINVGVGYAISINQARHFLGALRGGWIVDHASLGATVQTDAGGRAIVANVKARSDAQRRGLRFGDEVVAFGGRGITSANALKNALGIYPSQWRVELTYRRDNQWHDILVRLEPLHTPKELAEQWQPEQKPTPARQIRLPVPDQQPSEPGIRPPGEPQPDLPMPDDGEPTAAIPPRADWPEVVRNYYETRSGFANYFFNRSEGRRVWAALGDSQNTEATGGAWQISGTQAFGDAVRIVFGDDDAAGTFGSQSATASPNDLALSENRPTDSETLLMALGLWRQILREGEAAAAETVYLGTFPLDANDTLYDTLELRFDGWTSRAMVDATAGQLAALEIYSAAGGEPIELRFSDFRSAAKTALPHTIRSMRAGAVLVAITVDRYDLDLDTDAVAREAESDAPAGD